MADIRRVIEVAEELRRICHEHGPEGEPDTRWQYGHVVVSELNRRTRRAVAEYDQARVLGTDNEEGVVWKSVLEIISTAP